MSMSCCGKRPRLCSSRATSVSIRPPAIWYRSTWARWIRITARPATMPGDTPIPVRRIMSSPRLVRRRDPVLTALWSAGRRRVRRLTEAGGDQRRERLDRIAFVGAVRPDRDRRSSRRRKQQNSHDALAVDLAFGARDADARLEAGGEVDEPRRRACVDAPLIHDG